MLSANTSPRITFCRSGLFVRSEEHTSELQSRVDISYAVFCLKKQQQRIWARELLARRTKRSRNMNALVRSRPKHRGLLEASTIRVPCPCNETATPEISVLSLLDPFKD